MDFTTIHIHEEDIKKSAARFAENDASDAAAYAKYLENENYRLIKENRSLTAICKKLFLLNDELRAFLEGEDKA